MSEAAEGEAKDLSVAVVVRRFEPADAEAVAAMMKDLAAFHGEAASDVAFHAFGPGRISDVWIVLLDEKPCAFAAAYDWMNYVIPSAETSDRSSSLILSRPRSGRVEGGASRLPRRGVEPWSPSSFDTGLSGPAQDEGR